MRVGRAARRRAERWEQETGGLAQLLLPLAHALADWQPRNWYAATAQLPSCCTTTMARGRVGTCCLLQRNILVAIATVPSCCTTDADVAAAHQSLALAGRNAVMSSDSCATVGRGCNVRGRWREIAPHVRSMTRPQSITISRRRRVTRILSGVAALIPPASNLPERGHSVAYGAGRSSHWVDAK